MRQVTFDVNKITRHYACHVNNVVFVRFSFVISRSKIWWLSGSTAVEKVSGDSISKESVKNIIKVAQASGKKLPRINASISLKGISVTDSKGNDMFDISIYR